jgi:thiol reductant ABC exporter CydD subunit
VAPVARRFLVLCGALGLATAATILVQASLLAWIVDAVFLRGRSLGEVAPALIALVGVALLRGGIGWALEAGGHRASAAATRDLRSAYTRHVLIDRPGDTGSGAAVTAAVQGVDALDPYFARYLPALILGIVVPIAVVIRVATIDLLSAGIMLLTIPLIPIFGILIGKATEAQARERYATLGRLSSHFLDVVRGLTTLRAFNRGAAQIDRIADTGEAYRRETMKTLRIAFLSALVLELAATLSVAIIAVEIGIRLVGGSLLFAPAFTVLILAPELYAPLRNSAAQFHASADGIAAVNDLLAPLEQPSVARGHQVPLDPRDVPIRFEHVGFAYADRPDAILRDLSLELVPGERVAILGPSGVGKSTLASLLLAFQHPDSGRIVVGGTDLHDVDPTAWRSLLAWVPQRPHLTTGTLAEAIALGRPDAPREAIADAARAAAAEDIIATLPAGLDTRVGSGGTTLSAGQVRRLALARALLCDASLLILDEPTTSVDADSAQAMTDAIARLPRTQTLLVITHDVVVAEAIADRTLTLADGRLVDTETLR